MMFRWKSPEGALASGCSLWIVQFPKNSSLSQKIDWHLQLVFAKSKISSNKSLLVESSGHLPNKQTLFIPENDWLQKAYEHWEKLNKPSLKLFPPSFVSKEEIMRKWSSQNLPYPIIVVLKKENEIAK